MATTMWEVRAADGKLDDLLDWVRARIPAHAALYRSAHGEPRVVVIDPAGFVADLLGDPPPELVARAAMSWNFERVPHFPAEPLATEWHPDSI
jgi:hypothetical protein